jgi:acyl carrier protein
LAKFPERIRADYARFQADGDREALDAVVLAVVRDHVPKKTHLPEEQPLTESARLVDDLGFDSLAITETVFFLEDLFKVRITNPEIMSVHTVGELRAFVRRKLNEVSAGKSA